MTKYEKMKKMADNLRTAASNAGDKFIRAAAKAKSTFMISLWTYRAEKIQSEINKMRVEEASEETGEEK